MVQFCDFVKISPCSVAKNYLLLSITSITHDIALIELLFPVDILRNDHILPACLPTEDPPVGSNVNLIKIS